jgi:uncharacterized protein (UPF0210 family)
LKGNLEGKTKAIEDTTKAF